MIIDIIIGIAVVANLMIWACILLLPWKPWDTAECLDAVAYLTDMDLSDVTVLIPARNEENTIGRVLSSVAGQGRNINILLVDDQSTDRTVEIAEETCGEAVKIVRGLELPKGWTGKLWALDQGLKHVNTDYTLLLDADIRLRPGIIATALKAKEQNNLNMLSLMAWLDMEHFWGKLLMPAFVYFFKLLYPFRLANFKKSRVAAAAGGFILVDTETLRKIKAFECIKDELIDDCALAGKIKSAGFSTWIGLTHSLKSMRKYSGLGDIWSMVERTAYTQLRKSFALLLAVTIIMTVMFWGEIAGMCYGNIVIWGLSWLGMTLMLITYNRTVSFYGLSFVWSLTLPLSAALYLMMTWSSAFRQWRGQGTGWKGRKYR